MFHKSTVPIVPTVSRTRKDTLLNIFQIRKSSRGLKNLLKFKGFYLKDKVVISVSRV